MGKKNGKGKKGGRDGCKGFLSPTKMWTSFESRSWGPNEDFRGLGSYGLGGRGYSLLQIPEAPTTSIGQRYNFILDVVRISHESLIVISDLAQAVVIGNPGEDQERGRWPLYYTQQDPFFYFPDGNITWGLRFVDGMVVAQDLPETSLPIVPGTWPGLYPQQPSLLYQPGNLNPYVPPSPEFPGKPLGGLGVFGDISFPWQEQLDDLSIVVEGPGTVYLCAQVYQTDPATRPDIPAPPPGGKLSDEVLFLYTLQQMQRPGRYAYIGGKIRYSLKERFRCRK